MNIDLDIRADVNSDFSLLELFSSIAEEISERFALKPPIYSQHVSVVITDNEEIRELNLSYRGIDSETDVLSFPMYEFDKPLKPKGKFINMQEGILGDIVISMPRACLQALEYGHSQKRELAFLFTHGMLHLLGFDHILKEDRQVMEAEQDKILKSLNINR